jgi:ABC-type sugar transport system substrate-binding protein
MDLSNPFFRLIADVMEAEAEKIGFKMICLDGENNADKQNTQLNDFVARGCAAIFLNPVDSNAAGAGVKRAHEAGIPVFTFDVQVTDPEAREMIVSHIGSDNYQGGRLAGESMMKATGDTGKIGIVSCPEITSCQLRVKGFRDYLADNNSQLEIVSELSGRANISDALNTATDMLQAHGDLVGIFAVNDPSARGVSTAVRSGGKQDQIVVIGFDASPEGKQAVFEKKLYDTPRQFPKKMAIGTVQALARYLNGEQLEKQEFIPCAHYTYEDAVQDTARDRW